MGAEISKHEGHSEISQTPNNHNNCHVGRQRIFIEDEVKNALEFQKRLYNERQSAAQNTVYPNLQTELSNRPSNSNNNFVTPSAPPHFLISRTDNHISRPVSLPSTSNQQLVKWQAEPTPGPSRSSFDAQNINRNKNNRRPKQKAPRNSSASQSWTNRHFRVNCVTCQGELGIYIYQCQNGHSSCQGCKSKMAMCATCFQPITDMRNITLEATIASMIVHNEELYSKLLQQCPNKFLGCKLYFNMDQMPNHLKECIYGEMICPINELNGSCTWKGIVKAISAHLRNVHPENCQVEVSTEMSILINNIDYKVLQLMNIGNFSFLLHIQVDTSLKYLYMFVQFLGTSVSAARWNYVIHVYQASNPRRKFEYYDICQTHATSVSDTIRDSKCAVINIEYAKTFLDGDKFTFKVFINKYSDN